MPTSPRAPSPPLERIDSYLGQLPGTSTLDFNIFFQNQRIAPTAPKQNELNPKYALPEEIHFYIRTSTYPCSFPLPREFSEERYLHRATVTTGHEVAGPAAQLRFNPSTVVGLASHHMVNGQCTAQLVLEVPVTRRYNPFLAPKRITFTPTTHAQLHCHRSDESASLPRIIVPVSPVAMSPGASPYSMTLVKNTRLIMLRELLVPWDGTPRGQRMYFAVKRWKRVVDAMYAEVPEVNPFSEAKLSLDVHATIGTPFRFGTWYPRAALDVPPYTTIYFQNARVSNCAPKPRNLPTKHLLPKSIFFYVRTMTAEVGFPLPEAEYPSHKYLHVARVIPGHESGGPAAHMSWSVDTVVGLRKHQCTKTGAPAPSMQLVLVVPSWVSRDGTQAVNEGLEPRQLAFSPTNSAQLHLSSRLPRVIVPVFPRPSLDQTTRFVDGVKSGARLQALRQLLGAWQAFSSREIKLSAMKRWIKVCSQMPKPKQYTPPEPQLGSPFVEHLRDLGEVKNRCRWPRLDRAIQLAADRQANKNQLAAGWSLNGNGSAITGIGSMDTVAKHAEALKLDVAAAQQIAADAARNNAMMMTRSQSDGLLKPPSASSPQASKQQQLEQDLARATPPARRGNSPRFGSPMHSARSTSSRRSLAESAAARAEARDALLAAAMARQEQPYWQTHADRELVEGEAQSSVGRSTPRSSTAAPRCLDQRGTHVSSTPSSARSASSRSASPRPGEAGRYGGSPRGGPMVRPASPRAMSPRFPRPGLNAAAAEPPAAAAPAPPTQPTLPPPPPHPPLPATAAPPLPPPQQPTPMEDSPLAATTLPPEPTTKVVEVVEPPHDTLMNEQHTPPVIMSSGRARALAAAGGGRPAPREF